MRTHHSLAHWIEAAEHGVLRSFIMLIGLVIALIGLGLGVTLVMLPAGIALGATGLVVFMFGATGDMPTDDKTISSTGRRRSAQSQQGRPEHRGYRGGYRSRSNCLTYFTMNARFTGPSPCRLSVSL